LKLISLWWIILYYGWLTNMWSTNQHAIANAYELHRAMVHTRVFDLWCWQGRQGHLCKIKWEPLKQELKNKMPACVCVCVNISDEMLNCPGYFRNMNSS
jgi:hypothetical protein